MKLNVSYKGEEIINYKPTQEQWWITGFYPPIQSADADDIKVEGEIDFKNAPEEKFGRLFTISMEKVKNMKRCLSLIH